MKLGAQVLPEEGVRFRVWAPACRRVEVVLSSVTAPLAPEEDGYFSGIVSQARSGACYRYRLNGDDAFPDPASRYQPEGPHGPSQVIDAAAFPWTDEGWQGHAIERAVIYEMHIGTFTREGTWEAARRELGVTRRTRSHRPRSCHAGGRFWGTVLLGDTMAWGCCAPFTRLPYGRPDDFRHFVNEAHQKGMGVILDVTSYTIIWARTEIT